MKRSPIFWGWWIVVAGFVCAFCTAGARYSFSIFMPDIIDEFGWTRTQVSAAYSIHMWLYVIAAPVVGLLTDRFGPRVLMPIGGLFIIAALTLTGTTSEIWHLYIFYGVIGLIGVSLCYMVPNLATVRKWFSRKAGLATGLVAAGSGLGIGIMMLVAASLIEGFGWRGSFTALGVGLGLACIIFSVLFMRKDPESVGLLPDGDQVPPPEDAVGGAWSLREALGTRSFWLLLAASFIASIPITAMLSQIVVWAELDLGIGRLIAALVVVAMTFTAVASRVVGGWVSDRWGRKPIFYIGLLGCALALAFAIGVESLSSLYVFAIIFGFFYALPVAVWPAYLGDLYGRASVGALFGALTIATGLAGGTGPLLYGYIYDALGSYDVAFIISAALCAVAIVLIFLIRPPDGREMPQISVVEPGLLEAGDGSSQSEPDGGDQPEAEEDAEDEDRKQAQERAEKKAARAD